jgi:branched-chain amino acid transport system permease protein
MSLPSGVFQASYGQDMAIFRTRTQWLLLLAFLVVLFTMPLYAGNRLLTISTIIGIIIISVLGLQILTGYCGQISIGHAGFMAAGGYVSAILTVRLGWPFWAALPCAGLGAGLVGIFFGLPSLKIKGFYLIMATVAAQFIIIWVILQFQGVTGGADGMSVPRPSIGSFVFESKASYFYLVMVIACAAVYFAKNIVRTRAGRAFIAIRDNDLAAEVMGINLWVYKLTAFFIGCVFAGLSGALIIHYYGYVSTDTFPFMDSVWYLGMLIVGGMGSITGVIFGTVFLKLLDELVTIFGPTLAAIFPAIAAQAAASLGLIMRGMIIIIFLIFEPRGLVHRWELIKSYYRRWPFSY